MQKSEASLLRKELGHALGALKKKEDELKKIKSASADSVTRLTVKVDKVERENARLRRIVRKLQKALAEYTCARMERPADDAAKGASPNAGSAGAGAPERRPARNVARDLAYYDNENNPSSDSLYNHRRKEFRKKVGSYLDGGEKGKGGGEKKIGPPLKHKGYSHKLKPTATHRYAAPGCELCGPSSVVIELRPSVKLFCEWHSSRITVVTIVAERPYCTKCRKITVADSPSIPGTILGANFLRVVMIYANGGTVDSRIAEFLWSLHLHPISPDGAGNARHAATNILAGALPSIEDHIAGTAPYIGRDESPIRYNARRGYAWIVVAGDAVYCVVVGGRGSAVLEIHFAAFRDIPSVTDEYAAYKRLENRQSDWSHILRKAEKWGIYGDGSDFVLHMRLLGMYHEIKKWDAADEETVGVLADQVLQIALEYGEGHEMYTVLLNALPTHVHLSQDKGHACTRQRHRAGVPQRLRQAADGKAADQKPKGRPLPRRPRLRRRDMPQARNPLLRSLSSPALRRLVEPLRRQAIPRGSHHRGHGQRQASEAGAFGTHPDKAPARNPARTPAGRGGSGRVIRRLGGGPASGAPLPRKNGRRPRGHSFEGRTLAPAPGAKSPHSISDVPAIRPMAA